MSQDAVIEKIEKDVKSNPILLFVKGNPMFPQCGFSKAVMDIFSQLGVDYETRNVLEDPEIRDGVKRYTDWPTIPQVFIEGEFVGGCDIIMEMAQNGELAPLVEKALKNKH